MTDKNPISCKHNPCRSSSWIIRFCFFLFRRDESLNSFRCEVCDTALHIPCMNTPMKVGFFWISIGITYGVIHSKNAGGVLSSFPPLIVICALFLFLFFMYRVVSSAILTFGTWFPSDCNVNNQVQEKTLKNQGVYFRSLALAGTLVCVTCLQKAYIAFFTLVASIVLIINLVIQKKWRICLVGLVSFIFSILSILGWSQHIVIECVILIAIISLSIAIT